MPLPVDPRRYRFSKDKEDYLLFLGRISPHKGAYEAAALAAAAGRSLVQAGPSWQSDYLDRVIGDHGAVVEHIGEVGGHNRIELIAAAVLVLSQSVPDPWGHIWSEPGATVVSDAAASGTPVIATRSGCLREIVTGVGSFVSEGASFDADHVRRILGELPSPQAVRQAAERRWHYRYIAKKYETLCLRLLGSDCWGHSCRGACAWDDERCGAWPAGS